MIATAIILLKRGEPLPLDLIVRLLAAGIDVAALEEKHGA